MQLNFIDLGLLLKADNIEIPYGLIDEPLFLTVKPYLLELLNNSETEIYHFGHAPDNTSDGQDELLYDGTLFRIIVNEKYVGVDFESSPESIKKAFYNLVSNYQPDWCSIMADAGETITEITIELLYREVF